jgi:hypothetical protein
MIRDPRNDFSQVSLLWQRGWPRASAETSCGSYGNSLASASWFLVEAEALTTLPNMPPRIISYDDPAYTSLVLAVLTFAGLLLMRESRKYVVAE